MDLSDFLHKVTCLVEQHRIRYAAVIKGDLVWRAHVLHVAKLEFAPECHSTIVQLGGENVEGYEYFGEKQGQRLLGQETRLLYIDMSSGADANSICAAIGTVQGGGVILFSPPLGKSPADVWLSHALLKLPLLQQDIAFPVLELDIDAFKTNIDMFEQQRLVVDNLVAIKRRRANRPIVVTAARGRGKSTALGIAAAELLQGKACSIVVTSSRWEAVKSVFITAIKSLDGAEYIDKATIRFGDSELSFVPPDILLSGPFHPDVVFVDEASSIPLPVLFQLCSSFPRIAFCTTIHGYEGCGRGFSLKFLRWLESYKPHYRQFTLSQPIRWAENDPIEAWVDDTFLLSPYRLIPEAEIKTVLKHGRLVELPVEQLSGDRALLSAVFHLLVDAHYQTSPNDLLQILSDKSLSVFGFFYQDDLYGCLTVIKEGRLSDVLAKQVSRGLRRPKGLLTPITFINQIGIAQGASTDWFRVMRIAVLPEYQQCGLGSAMIEQLLTLIKSEFISTSFGATAELYRFWCRNQFVPVKLGSYRDSSSGCYSVLMIHQSGLKHAWAKSAYDRFRYLLPRFILRENLSLDLMLSRLLLNSGIGHYQELPVELLKNYAQGGTNYESVSVWLESFYLSSSCELRQRFEDVFILKVMQNKSWSECASALSLSGKAKVEEKLRDSIRRLLF